MLMLYRGRNWARWLVAVLSFGGGLVGFVSANTLARLGMPTSAIIAMGTLALIYVASSLLLVFSPSVRAFLQYQKGYAVADG